MKNKNYLYGTYALKTDIGKVRISQEDRVLALTNPRGNILLVVCDGMGGQNKGEYAAQTTIDMLRDAFEKKQRFWSLTEARAWLLRNIRIINNFIYNNSEQNESYKGMGTTMTLVLILNNYYFLGQIGDSRCYEINNESKLEQMSIDQTYVYYLYKTGQIKKEEIPTHPKRHILMNALGVYPMAGMELTHHPYHGQTLLVCSDGLYNNVQESEIQNILLKDDSTSQKVNELVSLANANGGSDNIGVVLWEANK